MDVSNLISGSSAFSKSSWYIWTFSVHILLKPSLKDFEHQLASMWNECNCMVVWIFFGIALLWNWNENWTLPVLWPLLSFPNLLAYSLQHFFFYFFYFFICGGFCHTLKWNSHGFTCVPHPNPPSHLPLHPFPLGFPSTPGPSACLMHPTWAGDLFHPR